MGEKHTSGIIIATGYDSIGRPIKPLTTLGTTTIVKRLIITFQLANISPIVVITGFDGLSVERHIANYGIIIFRMQDFTTINLKTDLFPAIEYVSEKSDQIVFAPVEYPLVEIATLKKLMNSKGKLRIPFYNGQEGYPLVMDSGILSECDTEKVGSAYILQDFLKKNNISVTNVPVDDEGVLCNVDDMERCNKVLKNHNEQLLHPYVRVDIDYASKVFDPRTKMLLQQIHDTGSVKMACLRVSISIGKAWELINTLEDALGYQVVNRRQGGSHGGSTELTEKGMEYLQRYMKLETDVREYANEQFEKIFGKEE